MSSNRRGQGSNSVVVTDWAHHHRDNIFRFASRTEDLFARIEGRRLTLSYTNVEDWIHRKSARGAQKERVVKWKRLETAKFS